MRKVIFGGACMVAGMLLVLVLLFVGAFPEAFGGLNLLGKCVVWLGILTAIFGLIVCLRNLEETNDE